MARKKSKANVRRSWKMERASVHGQGIKRPRSNKYSGSDSGKKPAGHARKGIWVGGYVRQDGVRVKGYYRTNAQYSWRRR